jgi:ADP-dependent NAD(P)H-hydrate dehydratase / NAD(P)H-hydrate epimerase
MKYVTVKEMQAIEREADTNGLSYAQMMENAGTGLAEAIIDACSHVCDKTVLGLVGSGNNGGDTLVALAYLAQRGWEATAFLVKPRSDDDILMLRLQNQGGKIIQNDSDINHQQLIHELRSNAIVLDGILGTGFHLPLKGVIADILELTQKIIQEKEEPTLVIAVDCPSGVDCDSGEAAIQTLPADITITMAAIKAGLLKLPAFPLTGEIKMVGIGLPDELPAWKDIKRVVADNQYVKSMLPMRAIDSHKGTFGTALIIAGSQNYTGAALLAGKAAYFSGAGLVTLAIPSLLHTALAGHFPEATWLLLPDEDGFIAENATKMILDNKERATAILIGPGFGLQKATELFIKSILKSITYQKDTTPMVIDADGLKLLSKVEGWAKAIPEVAILTPHPGEMAVLTGLSTDVIQKDRLNIAEKYAREWGHVIVLKGAFTIVASPDGRTGIIPIASPALARAGSGDVLAGIITGLRAQGVSPFESALAGAWIHGRAGLIAAEALGSTISVIAGDILMGCVNVMAELENFERLTDMKNSFL